MNATESLTTMQLERSKVVLQDYLAKTHMAGSTIEAFAAFDVTMKTMVVRLEATLYGRTLVHNESNPITLEVFDPDHVQSIPATWWDHFKMDLSTWLYRCPLGGWLENLNVWLRRRVRTVPAPQSHHPRTIVQSIRNVTAVCPHIGGLAKIDQHLQFVAFGLRDPRPTDFHVAPVDDLDSYLENSRAWREHVFRHKLLALSEHVDALNSGTRWSPQFDQVHLGQCLMDIKDLFDQYGIGT